MLLAAYANEKLYVAGGETTGGVSAGFIALTCTHQNGMVRLPDLPKRVSHTIIDAGNDSSSSGVEKEGRRGQRPVYIVYRMTSNRWMERHALHIALRRDGIHSGGGKICSAATGGDLHAHRKADSLLSHGERPARKISSCEKQLSSR